MPFAIAHGTNWESIGAGLVVAGLAALGLLVPGPWDFWVEVGCLSAGSLIVVIGSLSTPRRPLAPSGNQAAIDALATLRAEGRRLYDGPDVGARPWVADLEGWKRRVSKLLTSKLTGAMATQFLNPPPLPPASLPDPQGPHLRVLEQQLGYLSSIIDRDTALPPMPIEPALLPRSSPTAPPSSTHADQVTAPVAETSRPQARSTRPTFRLDRRDGDWLLTVGNDGPVAVFHANIRVTRASPFPDGVGKSFPLYWERARALEAKIVPGAEDSCRIARVDMPGQVIGAVVNLAMYRFDERTERVWSFWNTGWLPGQTEEASAHFEVVVTAEPEMEDDPVRLRFRLGPWSLVQESFDSA